jgi:hypothetical protein
MTQTVTPPFLTPYTHTPLAYIHTYTYSIDENDSDNLELYEVDDDTSIATSEVLSDNDQELLNTSDHDTIHQTEEDEGEVVGEKVEVMPEVRGSQSRASYNVKSSTLDSKQVDIIEQMQTGMVVES